ncbi:polysaccharide pyruvyl transferase family protein [Xylanibacter rarus]|uniref:polysaccharide pyruvyl transferase family protein n=1 Tax=Xylanibacter rarus TaxID=1676614 RepID=UPI003FD72361
MKKVGIITFHASHNYGSMLQAYALQQVIFSMGYDCEIINFRNIAQKEMYKPIFMKGTLYGKCVRFIIQSTYVWGILKKYRLFEKFLKEELILSSKEYNTLKDLENENFDYDYYISGSDQIWNVLACDFSCAYFLPFVKFGKRIAYAPSIGPHLNIEKYGNIDKIYELLNKYDAVSVREIKGSQYIENIINKQVPTVLDPTLLLDSNRYDNLIDKKPLINGEYVFIYSPWSNENVYEMAYTLGQKYQMKVVISQGMTTKDEMLKWNRKFKIYAAVGPKEFLNLCKNASIICCDSFHAVVFSILFKKCFFVFEGMSDDRISNLLRITHLQNRSFSLSDDYLSASLHIDYTRTSNDLEIEREKSLKWLKTNLDVYN